MDAFVTCAESCRRGTRSDAELPEVMIAMPVDERTQERPVIEPNAGCGGQVSTACRVANRSMSALSVTTSPVHAVGARASNSGAVGAPLGHGKTKITSCFRTGSRSGPFLGATGSSPSAILSASERCTTIFGAFILPQSGARSGARCASRCWSSVRLAA